MAAIYFRSGYQIKFKLLQFIYDSDEAARSTATKIYNDSALDNYPLSIATIGDPDLIAGVPIKINNLRDDIPQDWYIKTASHSISKSGYVTSLQLCLKEI